MMKNLTDNENGTMSFDQFVGGLKKLKWIVNTDETEKQEGNNYAYVFLVISVVVLATAAVYSQFFSEETGK